MKSWKNKIYYSQCWEDPKVLTSGLEIEPEDIVLSVTSGGCNTLALLLENPRQIFAIDINPIQNYLLELKIVAIKNFEYEPFLGFMGVSKIDNRIDLFEKIKSNLSPEALKWWSANKPLIKTGIVHVGKFEKYLAIFRTAILPLIHSRKTIDRLFGFKTLDEQKNFYNGTWNNWRWRFLFKIFFSGFVMRLLGRNPALFKYAGVSSIGEHYLKKAEYAFTTIPIDDNFFMEYILNGTYRSQYLMPPYLQEKNFGTLRARVDRITFVTADMKEFLSSRPNDYLSKFNLSDVFEAMSTSDTEVVFDELVRVGKNDSRIVYWTNLVEREFPSSFIGRIKNEMDLEKKLKSEDRVFFYSNLHVNTVIK